MTTDLTKWIDRSAILQRLQDDEHIPAVTPYMLDRVMEQYEVGPVTNPRNRREKIFNPDWVHFFAHYFRTGDVLPGIEKS